MNILTKFGLSFSSKINVCAWGDFLDRVIIRLFTFSIKNIKIKNILFPKFIKKLINKILKRQKTSISDVFDVDPFKEEDWDEIDSYPINNVPMGQYSGYGTSGYYTADGGDISQDLLDVSGMRVPTRNMRQYNWDWNYPRCQRSYLQYNAADDYLPPTVGLPPVDGLPTVDEAIGDLPTVDELDGDLVNEPYEPPETRYGELEHPSVRFKSNLSSFPVGLHKLTAKRKNWDSYLKKLKLIFLLMK